MLSSLTCRIIPSNAKATPMPASHRSTVLLISLFLPLGSSWGVALSAKESEASWPRFRGAGGDGVSSETGLRKQWPTGGPKLLWTAKGIGQGFASVTIAAGRIYTAGDIDNSNTITALDLAGRIVWQVTNGASWTGSGPDGAHGTPTIDGDRLYHENAYEEVLCLEAATGKRLWGLNLAEVFGGQRDGFGRAESLLIDGARVICCPGGAAAVAALDKKTGRTLWKSPSVGEPAGYASPILAECRGLRLILTMSQKSLIGVHADTGALLFRFEHYTPRYVANCVTPIYHDGHVFISGGYGKGSVLLKLHVEGAKATVEPVWRTPDLDNRHGGVVLLDGSLYGAAQASNNGKWVCLDWKTGKLQYAQRGVGQGSLVSADGMLYTLSERRRMGLVAATPTGHTVISQFTVPAAGGGPSWAHPVICGGVLYVRHGDFLYAYNVAVPSG